MIDPHQAMENLDLLYGTLDDPEQWHAWLGHTSGLLRSDGGSIVVTSHHDDNVMVVPDGWQSTPIMIQNVCTPAQLESYLQEFAPIDWQRERLKNLKIGEADALSNFPEPVRADYRETQFFQEFANDTCLRNFMGGLFRRDERWLGNLAFYRYRLEDPFLPREVAYVARLNAHTHRLLLQSEYITFLEDAVGALGGTVDAIYLIDQHGYVQYANAAASRLAEEGRLTVQDGRLLTPDRVGMSRLRPAIAACLAKADGCVAADLVIGGEGCSPLVVSVAPNRRKCPLIPTGASVTKVVVTARDPQASPPLNRRVLAHVYQLTSRELDICELLAAQMTLRRVAEHLGISYATARTHLKTIFRKVGVNAQAELIQRVNLLRD